MNLFEMDELIGDLENRQSETTKVASEGNNLKQRCAAVIDDLHSASLETNPVDFYEQYDLMQKKANSVARKCLGLDTNAVGNPTPLDALDFLDLGTED